MAQSKLPSNTYSKIYDVVRQIPPGKVATYGQVAELAGLFGKPRVVGYALFRVAEPDDSIPWQRVVNSKGEVSYSQVRNGSDYLQRHLLEEEGIEFKANGKIDLNLYRWDAQVLNEVIPSESWKRAVQDAIANKLLETHQHFSHKTLLQFDIGVFPWHGTIDLSFLFKEDQISNPEYPADWPHFNFSEFAEGQWPQIEEACNIMQQDWEKSLNPVPYFIAVANIATSPQIEAILDRLNESEDFKITVFDMDDPNRKNYVMATSALTR